MDLLKTILLYLTMVFVSSVQTVPEPSVLPNFQTPVPSQTVASATATPEPTPTPTAVPTPAITPNTAYRTLKVGDKGDDIKLMQRRLAELGYYTGDVDGVFGNQTRRSVERFQYYQGLSVDGIAGKRTLTVLYESTEVVYAPVDVSPSVSPAPTVGPTTAITSAPPTLTPAPTFVPTPAPVTTATSGPITASANTETAAPTQTPLPVQLDQQVFVLAGADTPITKLLETPAPSEEPSVLHPLTVGDQVFVPFLELLRSAGFVLVPGNGNEQQEVVFSMPRTPPHTVPLVGFIGAYDGLH